MKKRIHLWHLDRTLFVSPILIFLIGVLSVYSASSLLGQSGDSAPAFKQLFWMGLGFLSIFLIVRLSYFKLEDFAWPLYVLTLFLLVVVLFVPARLGAHRWIGVGGFNLQPSEIAKLAVILMLSRFFARRRIEFVSKRDFLLPFAVVLAPFLLIMKEPDLGTAFILIPIFLSMLYLWGLRGRFIVLLLVLLALAAPLLFMFLKEYQKARLLVFINPNMDPLGAGYTIIQSKIAIGSGGIFGKGFMGGSQNQLHFLPERHTDFIFGVIAEEGGFLVSAALLALFWLIVRKGYGISAQTPDRFGSQLACGISTLLGVQTIMNIGMTMGLLPVVGVPLPLVSYGGSSVVTTLLLIGLLMNIKLHRPFF